MSNSKSIGQWDLVFRGPLPAIIAFLVMALPGISGCSDTVGGNDDEDVQLIPGNYTLEYDLFRDECEPSMAEVLQTVDGIPQIENVPVGSKETEPSGRYAASFRHKSPRVNESAYLVTYHDAEGILEETSLPTYVFPEQEIDPTFWYLSYTSMKSELDVHFPETGQIVIDVTTEWGDRKLVEYPDDGTGPDAFIPIDACVESFRVTYSVDTTCMPYEYCWSLPQNSTSIEGPGSYRFTPQRLECNCTEPGDEWDITE